MTTAYPLKWPDGWKRTAASDRKRAQFGVTKTTSSPYGNSTRKAQLSIAEGYKRVREQLARMGVDVANDMVVSTNLKLNMSGLPRGDQAEPGDSGVAVFWQKANAPMRVMAVDTYYRVADNLGAIAATLEAMRAIERHGGAVILDRAFQGFAALPAPTATKAWWEVLGVGRTASAGEIEAAWRARAKAAHPDVGGSAAAMAEINAAHDAALKERVGR